ncbi:hypothetical protein BDV59DRAFT_199478 [Aspergillus ambiguus]|uniref:uncharacterized protein n=1 Tax=Aspergillus ambiguus TaxID=176160 RepID=UPI003CCDC5D6
MKFSLLVLSTLAVGAFAVPPGGGRDENDNVSKDIPLTPDEGGKPDEPSKSPTPTPSPSPTPSSTDKPSASSTDEPAPKKDDDKAGFLDGLKDLPGIGGLLGGI